MQKFIGRSRLRVSAAAAIAVILAATTGVAVRGAQTAGQALAATPPYSNFFSTVDVSPSATVGAPAIGDGANHGDLWPNCWSNDDNVYTAYGDGIGFGSVGSDIGTARISGMPGSLSGTQLALGNAVGQVWNSGHTRKPTGMACVAGDLYLAVQDLSSDFNAAPAATIAKSTNKGVSWTWNNTAPMFSGGVFTTIMFLDYGKDYANQTDGYVYAYGIDHNWRDSFSNVVPDPVDLYLARVPSGSVQNRAMWQFSAGLNTSGTPIWSTNIAARVPVLNDDHRVYTYPMITSGRINNMTTISQGGVLYNKPLNRYIYTSWTEYTFEFYESPTPWGPWNRMDSRDFGGYPWTLNKKAGGYATTIPSKYISADGKSMWLQSNVCPCGGGTVPAGDQYSYTFSLRPLRLEPRVTTTASNVLDGARNLAREAGTVQYERATHFGNRAFYNDNILTNSEDDWNDELKPGSWWGYTWPRNYQMNKVLYTTGAMFGDGGWFSAGMRVQVRNNGVWADVAGPVTTPAYPFNNTAGPNKTYTLSFTPTIGDGVRIIGTPGGTAKFTSIGELKVLYS